MQKFIAFILLSLGLTFHAQAVKKAEKIDKKAIGKAIYDGYVKSMNNHFLAFSNLAKSSADQKEFFEKLTEGITKDGKKPNFDKLKGQKLPTFLTTKNNIEFTFDGKKHSVKLSSRTDSLIIDGKELSFHKTASIKRLPASLIVLQEVFFTEANAQMWRLANYLGEALDILLLGETSYRTYSFAQKVKAWLTLVGVGTGAGAAVGCAGNVGFYRVSVALEDEYPSADDTIRSCTDGALFIGGMAFAMTAIVYPAAKGLSWGAGHAIDIASDINSFKPFAKATAAPEFIRNMGVLGVMANIGVFGTLGVFFDPIVFANGARLICGKDGDFEYSSYGEPKRGYSVGRCTLEPCLPENPTDDHIIRNIRAGDTLPPENRAAVASVVQLEFKTYKEECLKHGEGYTKSFRLNPGPSLNTISPSRGSE